MNGKRKKPFVIEIETDEHTEAWVASFADIMCLLLGFFMILYSLSHMDDKKFYELGKSISSSFKAIETEDADDIPEEIKDSDRQIRAFQMLVAVLNLGNNPSEALERTERMYSSMVEAQTAESVAKEQLKEELLQTEVLKEQIQGMTGEQKDDQLMELILPDEILFEAGTDRLRPQALDGLREIAEKIYPMREFVKISIVGHTDSRPPGRSAGFATNWHLSSARANAVLLGLMEGGLPGPIMSAVGKAHHDPLLPEFDGKGEPLLENMRKNRRVQIILERGGVGG